MSAEGFVFNQLSPEMLILIAVGIAAAGVSGTYVARSSHGKHKGIRERKRGHLSWIPFG